MSKLPGYNSVAQFAKEVKLPYMTVVNQLNRGYCPWPRHKMNGQTSNLAYKCWENMIQRCTNPNFTDYKNYGGRGIKLHPTWISFEAFIRDMGPRPGREYSIDRIDVNGNYEPSNVRWATIHEQANNKRIDPRRLSLRIPKHGKFYRFMFAGKYYSKETLHEAITLKLTLIKGYW